MLQSSVGNTVKGYLSRLQDSGIKVSFAVIYGSAVEGFESDFNDIDAVIVSPDFDNGNRMDNLESLWRNLDDMDSIIEPFPCGEREWDSETDSRILEMARQGGVIVEPD